MKRKILLLILLLVSGITYSLVDLNPDNMKNIDAFLKHQVDQGQTPSIQYSFFDTDSSIYELRYGRSQVKENKAIDATTTYHLYSVTKTFTALAVLQLAQAGKIHLDRPAADYLTDFPYSNKITVEQLLGHTAGIPNPLPLRWIHLAGEHGSFDRDAFFKGIFRKYLETESEPGTKFNYSNLGYVLLGQLVEEVSGQTFENYVQDHIITPCGLTSSQLGFAIDPSQHATGYHQWWSISNALFGFLFDKEKFMGPREGKWKPFRYFYNNGIAYGGLIGSGKGLVHYAQELLKDNAVLLRDDYKRLLFTERSIGNRPTGMSLSWYTGTLKGHRYVAHAGGGGGYYVELRLYPELGVGSVILYNRSGMRDERILDKADSFFIAGKEMQ